MSEFDVSAEAIMDGKHSYYEAVSKLIIGGTLIEDTLEMEEKAFVAKTFVNKNKKCYPCGIVGHLAKDCVRKKSQFTGKDSGGKKRTCFAGGKPGHFGKDCKARNGVKYAETTTTM